MRPKNQQLAAMKQEARNQDQNEKRKTFWSDMQGISTIIKEILAVKKREKKGKSDNNDALDDELAPLYLKLCEFLMPVMMPYLQGMARAKLAHQERERQAQEFAVSDKPDNTKKLH